MIAVKGWTTLAACLWAAGAAAQEAPGSGEAAAPQAGAQADAAADVGVLYPDEGADITYGYCIACHSERIIAQQGLTRERWDELLVWMVEKQGMPELPEEDRETILDYLAEHYNTDRPHFRRR